MKTTHEKDATRTAKSIQDIYFDQCVDFLARMIEKYGDTIPQAEDTQVA